jgi:hypothetical protein
MSSSAVHKPNYFNAVRAGVERYLGRRLTDDEFADMCSKIEVIERSDDALLHDANFIIGDALFRKLCRTQREIEEAMSSWVGGWVIRAFVAIILAMVLLGAGLFEAGRCSSAATATLDAWNQSEARIAAIRKSVKAELTGFDQTVTEWDVQRRPLTKNDYLDLLKTCATALDVAVAYRNSQPAFSAPHFSWRSWLLAAGLGLPAIAVVGWVGFLFGRYRHAQSNHDEVERSSSE